MTHEEWMTAYRSPGDAYWKWNLAYHELVRHGPWSDVWHDPSNGSVSIVKDDLIKRGWTPAMIRKHLRPYKPARRKFTAVRWRLCRRGSYYPILFNLADVTAAEDLPPVYVKLVYRRLQRPTGR